MMEENRETRRSQKFPHVEPYPSAVLFKDFGNWSRKRKKKEKNVDSSVGEPDAALKIDDDQVVKKSPSLPGVSKEEEPVNFNSPGQEVVNLSMKLHEEGYSSDQDGPTVGSDYKWSRSSDSNHYLRFHHESKYVRTGRCQMLPGCTLNGRLKKRKRMEILMLSGSVQVCMHSENIDAADPLTCKKEEYFVVRENQFYVIRNLSNQEASFHFTLIDLAEGGYYSNSDSDSH